MAPDFPLEAAIFFASVALSHTSSIHCSSPELSSTSPSHCSSDDFTSKSGSSIQHRATHCSSRSPLYRLWCLHFNLGLRHRATHCLVVERHISSLLFSPRPSATFIIIMSVGISTSRSSRLFSHVWMKSRFHHQASAQSSREPLSSFHPSSSSWTFDVISTIVVSSIYSLIAFIMSLHSFNNVHLPCYLVMT